MDAFFWVLAALFMAAMVGITAVLIAMGRSRTTQQRGTWREAAAQLGFEVVPPPGGSLLSATRYIHATMRGQRGGMRVQLDVVRFPTDHNSVTYYTHLRVFFPEPLRAGFVAMPPVVAGSGDYATGPTAGNHDVGWAINASPEVIEALHRSRRHPFEPCIVDDGVISSARGMYASAQVLADGLDDALDLAQRVLAAHREAGPDPVGKLMGEVWARVARSHGLTLEVEQRRMFGRCEGVRVCVDTVSVASGTPGMEHRSTRFTVRFDRPLGVGLELTQQRAGQRLERLLGGQDLEVGDPDFDGRFVVRGEPADQVRALLTPEVRAALVRIQSVASRLVVQDDHLMAELAGLVTDEASLDKSLVTVARAGAALAQATQREVSPYRA